jgi:diaminohydroxyphosphoribosylaminopyrimidine deaminase/5-amino-6-(5-phosphoribosylamino)uracil reductase
MVGSGTAIHDDPLLTARSGGPRKPLRVLFDGQLQLKTSSQLAQTAKQFPTLIWTGPKAHVSVIEALRGLECEVFQSRSLDASKRLRELLEELGRRRCTNLLCEGGAGLLGALFDQRLLDEVHLFVAPKIIGGAKATSPVGGLGLSDVNMAARLLLEKPILTGDDIYLRGLVEYKEA